MELKDKIKEIRKESGLSLMQFANALNVSDTAVLKWEQGKTEPKASNLKQLAVVFYVDLDDLLDIKQARYLNQTKNNS